MLKTWNNNISTPGNIILTLNNCQLLVTYWEFLLEGLQAVQAKCWGNHPDVTPDQFFKTLLRISCEPDLGVIFVLLSKTSKPLGFVILIDTSELFGPKTCCVYTVYSNGKCPSTISELLHACIQWAKKNGFEKYRALTYRIVPKTARVSGAVRRFFHKTLGLRERCVVFEASVTD